MANVKQTLSSTGTTSTTTTTTTSAATKQQRRRRRRRRLLLLPPPLAPLPSPLLLLQHTRYVEFWTKERDLCSPSLCMSSLLAFRLPSALSTIPSQAFLVSKRLSIHHHRPTIKHRAANHARNNAIDAKTRGLASKDCLLSRQTMLEFGVSVCLLFYSRVTNTVCR